MPVTFRSILLFKLFMILLPWGFLPLLVPRVVASVVGLSVTGGHLVTVRVIGAVVLAVFPFYLYIYKKPTTRVARSLMLAAVIDNGGLGALLLWLSFRYELAWVAVVNALILLFFAMWFGKFLWRRD